MDIKTKENPESPLKKLSTISVEKLGLIYLNRL